MVYIDLQSLRPCPRLVDQVGSGDSRSWVPRDAAAEGPWDSGAVVRVTADEAGSFDMSVAAV
jgi:hypothetical protein